MARYDKYDPISGGFRARLNAALTLTAEGGFFGAVSLNAQGRVVAGTAGPSGFVGVCVKNVVRAPRTQWAETMGAPVPHAPIGAMAGDVIDIMTAGEIVDLDPVAFPAGTKFYADADGTLTSTAGALPLVGWTVEAGRLIVRV